MLSLSLRMCETSCLVLGAKFKMVVFPVKLFTVEGLVTKLPLTKVDLSYSICPKYTKAP